MKTEKALVKLIDALTVEAANCSELARVQREAADKQRVTACRLEELSDAIEDIAIELRADLIVKAGGRTASSAYTISKAAQLGAVS